MPDDAPRYAVSPDDVETLVLPWGTAKWLVVPDATEAARLSLGVKVIDAGREIPRHQHPDSEVLLYVISGRGEQTVGSETVPLQPGTAVVVPAGAYHSTANNGWEPLKLLITSAPPGVEDEMRVSGEVRVVSAGKTPRRP